MAVGARVARMPSLGDRQACSLSPGEPSWDSPVPLCWLGGIGWPRRQVWCFASCDPQVPIWAPEVSKGRAGARPQAGTPVHAPAEPCGSAVATLCCTAGFPGGRLEIIRKPFANVKCFLCAEITKCWAPGRYILCPANTVPCTGSAPSSRPTRRRAQASSPGPCRSGMAAFYF